MSEHEVLALTRRKRRLINEEPNGLEELGPIVGYADEPLVSLLDACQPLVDLVDSILRYASIAVEMTPADPADGLTRDESASIRLYTMEWDDYTTSLYSVLNQTLRARGRTELRPWFKYLKLIFTALVKIPCAPVQTVWRGLRENVCDTFPRGAEIIWWSFSSCTRTLTVLDNELYLGAAGTEGRRTLFSIEVFNARDISAHSDFQDEDEILLLPATYVIVQSQLNPTTDLHIIHLRQEIPKTMLLEPPFEGAPLYLPTESSKHRWYRKKKYFIPIGVLFVLSVVAIILGLALGLTAAYKNSDANSSQPGYDICTTPRWNRSGITVAGGNGKGSNLNQFDSPDGIFVEPNGSVYVVDCFNDRIVKWDSGASEGYIVAGGNGRGNAGNQFNFPVDLVIDRNGTMYITDFFNNRVQQWFPGASSGQTILADLKFIGIEQDDQGSLYTSDGTNNQVQKWLIGSTTGQLLASNLYWPTRLYVDENRSVYVADRVNNRVIKITDTPASITVVAGGSSGDGATQLNLPYAVTADASGSVYVADTQNHRIVRWLVGATSGTLVVGNGNVGSGPYQLNTPTDVQFDLDGNLYVADSGNNRVQKFLIVTSPC